MILEADIRRFFWAGTCDGRIAWYDMIEINGIVDALCLVNDDNFRQCRQHKTLTLCINAMFNSCIYSYKPQ